MKPTVPVRVQEEFEDFIDNNLYDLKKIYERGLGKYYMDVN